MTLTHSLPLQRLPFLLFAHLNAQLIGLLNRSA